MKDILVTKARLGFEIKYNEAGALAIAKEMGMKEDYSSDAIEKQVEMIYTLMKSDVSRFEIDGIGIKKGKLLAKTLLLPEVQKIFSNSGATLIIAIKNIDNLEWYEIITEYILYSSMSFKTLIGSSYYVAHMGQVLEQFICIEKAKRIQAYVTMKSEELFQDNKYYSTFLKIKQILPSGTPQTDNMILQVESLIDFILLTYPNGRANRFLLAHFKEMKRELNTPAFIDILSVLSFEVLKAFDVADAVKNKDGKEIHQLKNEFLLKESNIVDFKLFDDGAHNYFKMLDAFSMWFKSKLNVLEKYKKEIPNYRPIKCAAKYYALYHLILIEMGVEQPFRTNVNDQYVKTEIEKFAKNRYPNISSQGFYKGFKEIKDSDILSVAKSYKDYKTILIDISGNNADLIYYLKKYPN